MLSFIRACTCIFVLAALAVETQKLEPPQEMVGSPNVSYLFRLECSSPVARPKLQVVAEVKPCLVALIIGSAPAFSEQGQQA